MRPPDPARLFPIAPSVQLALATIAVRCSGPHASVDTAEVERLNRIDGHPPRITPRPQRGVAAQEVDEGAPVDQILERGVGALGELADRATSSMSSGLAANRRLWADLFGFSLSVTIDSWRVRSYATTDDIDELVADTRERTVFELTDAIGAADRPRALAAVAALCDQRESAVGVVVMLARHVRQLTMVYSLRDSGAPRAGWGPMLGVPPFVVDKLIAQARSYSPQALSTATRRLANADRALKGDITLTSTPPSPDSAFTGPQKRSEQQQPPEAFVDSFLWIIAAGVPKTLLTKLRLEPAPAWPAGVYFFGEDILRVGIIVASELPRERTTLLVRLMAAGPLLPQAVKEVAALPATAHERAVAEPILLNFQHVLGLESSQTPDEQEFIMAMHKSWEDARAEGRADALLTVLRVRGIAVPDATRDRILAQKDQEQLKRWLEKAVAATSIGEVIDDQR